VGLAVCSHHVQAWNKDGHEAVGMTASSASVRAATQHVKSLLDSDDLVDVSFWAHEVADREFDWARQMHFQPQPDTCELTSTTCEADNNLCLLPMIKHFYNQLNKANTTDVVTFPDGTDWSDQDAVKILSNLLADLHQPAHLGFQSWDMGRQKKVKFQGTQMSAYEYWDNVLINTFVQKQPNFWYSGWTHIRHCKADYDKAVEQWREHGEKCFDLWAQESLKIACEQIFQNKLFTGSDVPDISKGYNQAVKIMKEQLLKAGVRTAVVMDALFTDEHQFTHGSAIKQDLPKFHREKQPRHTLLEFGFNAILMFAMLGFFFWLLKRYSGKMAEGLPTHAKPTKTEMANLSKVV